MKRMLSLCAAALCLTMALAPTALAADFETAPPNAKVCYPTSIVRSDDGTELKKIYDLGPEDDPAGIPRSDFQKDGFRYTLTDLLKQELPENESRQHMWPAAARPSSRCWNGCVRIRSWTRCTSASTTTTRATTPVTA